uniref:PepSY domain-containing protein n=1 Tax=Atopococcus tabaci TaxID=269774 RepID=UPI0030C73EE9
DILNLEGIIMQEEEMSHAEEEAGSGHVEEWELDVENGTTNYEIDMEGTDGAFDDDDIRVNAQTGEIINQ